MDNLMDGLLKELNRCRELKLMYDEIPTGKFGSIMIQRAIDGGEKAIAENDVVKMLASYKELKECQ